MQSVETRTRGWIARAFTLVEDVVYLGLALLTGIVLTLLVTGFTRFGHSLMAGELSES